MAKNLFSVSIFFIVFRETLEAAIIVSVLLGLVEQIVSPPKDSHVARTASPSSGEDSKEQPEPDVGEVALDDPVITKRLIKRLRWQIFLGAGLGFLVALAIGAAFIAVWFTQASNLWEKSEHLWEGIFSLIAAILIFIMALSMLKLDRAKSKWKVKLQHAFHISNEPSTRRRRWFFFRSTNTDNTASGGTSAKSTKLILFLLPFLTVLREGIEAIIFVGGVSLGQPATSIPIATIVGIICGVVCGVIIYAFASRAALSVFLVVMTNFLLLIGAGLFSRTVSHLEKYEFGKLLGGEAEGAFEVTGYVWRLNCCSGSGWSIFGALFGWTNTTSIGTVLSYVFYWIAVIMALVWMKWHEGRITLFGKESAVRTRRRERRAAKAVGES